MGFLISHIKNLQTQYRIIQHVITRNQSKSLKPYNNDPKSFKFIKKDFKQHKHFQTLTRIRTVEITDIGFE